jgi:hypothetical protein
LGQRRVVHSHCANAADPAFEGCIDRACHPLREQYRPAEQNRAAETARQPRGCRRSLRLVSEEGQSFPIIHPMIHQDEQSAPLFLRLWVAN